MPRLTVAQRESLKKAILTASINRLTIAETKDFVKDKLGFDMSLDYLWRLKASLRKESQEQIDVYRKDKFAYIDEAFTKRLREFEDNQSILRTIIYSNKDNPEAQIKAVAQLNETTILIHNLFSMLPNLVNGLGVDAFVSSSNSNSNNNNDSIEEVIEEQKKGKGNKEDLKPEWSV